jgi:hypothetical protein
MMLEGRVGPVIEPILQSAVLGLARGLQDRSVDAEEPPMVAAAYSSGIDQSKLQGRAAVGAMQLQ